MNKKEKKSDHHSEGEDALLLARFEMTSSFY